ncbi:DUF2971 domain-containing protein [Christiangramia forsetii]|uniref:DUF2971 domain-containing protein n=2 Tax=Christiangramia forsetii TaxID=411153 RepID=A0LZW2_CHRFK|nr:DUF2971 domain-containing protein [Christiangramia forsetii]GGG46478.1 hypothetical protein GCM10011532_32950 [Christiangramia forsetii]CAL65907.1 conserved hypothetical protein [Christiangramia forsetii KT0803]
MEYLFKYHQININLYKSLQKNEVWFANPSTFNDPFDCNLKCHYIIDKYYQEQINEEQRIAFNSATHNEIFFRQHKNLMKIAEGHEKDRKEKTEKLNSDLQKRVSEVGISCFSKTHLSILMWSHYANNHSGVCLKFNTKDKSFFEDYKEVKYSEEFPTSDDIAKQDKSDNFLFFTKSQQWSYEQEVRLMKKADSLEIFDPQCLEAIYFGLDCVPKEQEKIIQIIQLNKGYNNVDFYKMQKSPKSFELIEEKIN